MPNVGHYIYTIAFAGHQQFIQGWGINSGGRDLSRIWFGGKINLNRSHRILFLAGAIPETTRHAWFCVSASGHFIPTKEGSYLCNQTKGKPGANKEWSGCLQEFVKRRSFLNLV